MPNEPEEPTNPSSSGQAVKLSNPVVRVYSIQILMKEGSVCCRKVPKYGVCTVVLLHTLHEVLPGCVLRVHLECRVSYGMHICKQGHGDPQQGDIHVQAGTWCLD